MWFVEPFALMFASFSVQITAVSCYLVNGPFDFRANLPFPCC